MAVTDKTDDAAVLLATKLNTLHAAFEILEGQVTALAQRLTFPIWAEENGGLQNNGEEWSFGNGATGNDIGIIVPMACELVSATFNADVFGTSVSIHVNKNNVSVEEPLFTSQNSTVNFTNPVVFQPGDLVSFQTGTLVGSTTDARICAWLRII